MVDPGQLLARAQRGDREAFEEFVRLTERRVRAVLRHMLGDERDVDEAAQDTYVQVWRRLEGFRGDSAATTWLHRIAVNTALQRVRRRTVPVTSLDDLHERDHARLPQVPTDEIVAGRELGAALARTLRAMPIEYRAPVVLRDIEGWSTDEVAAALGLSVAAVKSRVHRGRNHVREHLEAWRRETT